MLETVTPVTPFVRRGERLIKSAEMLAGWEDLRFWRLQRDDWAAQTTQALRRSHGPWTAQLFECSAGGPPIAGELVEVLPEELRRVRDALAVLASVGREAVPESDDTARIGARITR